MTETWHMMGEGGGVFEMTLPLDPNIEQRYLNGDIKRVSPDGTPWKGDRTARNRKGVAAAAGMLEEVHDA